MSETKKPFVNLGAEIKQVREQSNQSLAEVSGAVEIDENQLARIEAGLERPSEDILLLLISHFDVQDGEAVKLWELAEYGTGLPDELRDGEITGGKQLVMLLAMETRTLYSDDVEIEVNSSGVTMHFKQDEKSSAAKVGMSHTQAEKVLRALEQALLRSKYLGNDKLLPPGV